MAKAKKPQSRIASMTQVRCPLYGDEKVGAAQCIDQTKLLQRNRGACNRISCKSPWRRCIYCVSQGVTDENAVVLDPIKGLCEFHAEHGPDANRSRVKVILRPDEGQALDRLSQLKESHRRAHRILVEDSEEESATPAGERSGIGRKRKPDDDFSLLRSYIRRTSEGVQPFLETQLKITDLFRNRDRTDLLRTLAEVETTIDQLNELLLTLRKAKVELSD